MEPIRSGADTAPNYATGSARATLSPFVFPIAVFLIVQVVSLGVWRLFVDPAMAIWRYYPQPFGMYLFWGILVLVFIGFNFDMAGFSTLKQPLRGFAATGLTLLLGFAIPGAFVYGYGLLDPTFAGGTGQGATGLIVLIGFYGFGILATGMAGWPWSDSGLNQATGGFAQLMSGACLTTLGYFLLVYPNLSSTAASHKVLLSLPVTIGWFYSVIVAWLTTFLIFDNWPWSMLKHRSYVALAAFVGNFLMGTAIYFGFIALVKSYLVPSEALWKIGAALPIWAAQLGVWIVFWLIFWANVMGNFPQKFGSFWNRMSRLLLCWGLGIVSFEFYTRWFAERILHESPITLGFSGDPLTWVDLLNFVMLIYIVYFDFFGLSKIRSANNYN